MHRVRNAWRLGRLGFFVFTTRAQMRLLRTRGQAVQTNQGYPTMKPTFAATPALLAKYGITLPEPICATLNDKPARTRRTFTKRVSDEGRAISEAILRLLAKRKTANALEMGKYAKTSTSAARWRATLAVKDGLIEVASKGGGTGNHTTYRLK